MAGDWIKMRSDLFTHPKVVRMASALQADIFRTVGGLMSAWCLFDIHSEDGVLEGYSPDVLDSYMHWQGFAAAMEGVGWLVHEPGKSLCLPRFTTHNGQSAKRRAQDADRKRDVRKMSATEADKKRTREEKRREEKNNTTPAPVPDAQAGFADFWDAWPKTMRKVAKEQCMAKWAKHGCASSKAEILEALDLMKISPSWEKNNGEFIPAPLVWLNQKRWTAVDSNSTAESGYI